MRSLASATIFLGFAAIASAAGCNPSYNVTAGPDCIEKCRESAGKGMSADYTLDPNSANFITSLSYECEKGTPAYTTYMTQSGVCMMNCSADDQADFGSREHADICTWYNAHKSDTCADGSSGSASASGSTSSSTSSSGADKPAESNSDSGSSSTGSDSSQSQTDDSAANSLKLGGLIVSVAAAGTAALLF